MKKFFVYTMSFIVFTLILLGCIVSGEEKELFKSISLVSTSMLFNPISTPDSDNSEKLNTLIHDSSLEPDFNTYVTPLTEKDLRSFPRVYLKADRDIMFNKTNVSGVVKSCNMGEILYVLDSSDKNFYQVMSSIDFKIGFIRRDYVEKDLNIEFTDISNTMYADKNTLIYSYPSYEAGVLGEAEFNQEIYITGDSESDFYRCDLGYVLKTDMMKEKYVVPKVMVSRNISSTGYTGGCLTPSSGVFYGPSGKESYYNLNMNGVISNMSSYGYSMNDYTVRSDGVKTLGGYVIVAANLSLRPRGSLVETSLGTGIVCDTGGFAYSDPTQVDIAVTW